MLVDYQRNESSTTQSEIDMLITMYFPNQMLALAKAWFAKHADVIKREITPLGNAEDIQVDNLNYRYASNIETFGDELLFDATVDCRLFYECRENGNHTHDDFVQRLTMRCKIVYNNGKIELSGISAYLGDKKHSENLKYPADKNLVPIINKDELDAEAERFLRIYCPEALTTPQPVPIMDILKEQMGLLVLSGAKLKDDDKTQGGEVFGQLFFAPETVEFICPQTNKLKSGVAPRGTVLLDETISQSDNIGCQNNTLAHEGFHWFRHRMRATIRNILYGNKYIACRRATKSKRLKNAWTGEDWLEWQTNGISPRILMPVESYKEKARELMAKHGYQPGEQGSEAVLETVIRDLADFFITSRQSAGIRLVETGMVADNELKSSLAVRRFNLTTFIGQADAFREYCENGDFRDLVDSGAVRYVEHVFVINDERYVKNVSGHAMLTAYARAHMEECCIKFVLRKDYPRYDHTIRGIAFRYDKSALKTIHCFEADQNTSILDSAEELQRLQSKFDDEFNEYSAATPTFGQLAIPLIKKRGWNSAIFKELTHLDDSAYSRIINDKTENISLRTVAAFCVGIGASKTFADKLFAAAGLAFNNSPEMFAYSFILTAMHGRSMDECNAFLESKGFTPLGNRQRREKEAVNQ